jgi:hypothetical protein
MTLSESTKRRLKRCAAAAVAFAAVALLFVMETRVVAAEGFLDKISDPVALMSIAVIDGIFWVLTRILWLSGVFLNISISWTLSIKPVLEGTQVVEIGWTILRDLGNMLFIFVLLYMSIMMIVGEKKLGTQKLLTSIVLAAFMMNFSLFFTKLIIDSSNVLAAGFYKAMTPVGSEGDWDRGLSNAFMQNLKLSTLFDTKEMKTLSPSTGLAVGVMGSVLILVTAFVFFAAAAMFMKRTIYLLFLLMTSSVAFLGMFLPVKMLQQQTSSWFSKLIAESFYAPVYMALTYILVKAITSDTWNAGLPGDNVTVSTGNFGAAIGGGDATAVAVLLNFFLIIGFALASVVAASSIGAMSAKGATDFAGKMTFGLVGSLGRNTFGRAASGLAKSEFVKEHATGRLGQFTVKQLQGVAGSGMDFRSTGLAGSLAEATKVNLGKASPDAKGGYDAKLKRQVKEREDHANYLGDTKRVIRSKRSLTNWRGKKLKDAQGNIMFEDQLLKEQYATSLKTRNWDTLWLKVARKDKEAAKKIMKDFDKKKKEDPKALKAKKEEAKTLADSIKKNDDDIVTLDKDIAKLDDYINRGALTSELNDLATKMGDAERIRKDKSASMPDRLNAERDYKRYQKEWNAKRDRLDAANDAHTGKLDIEAEAERDKKRADKMEKELENSTKRPELQKKQQEIVEMEEALGNKRAEDAAKKAAEEAVKKQSEANKPASPPPPAPPPAPKP